MTLSGALERSRVAVLKDVRKEGVTSYYATSTAIYKEFTPRTEKDGSFTSEKYSYEELRYDNIMEDAEWRPMGWESEKGR